MSRPPTNPRQQSTNPPDVFGTTEPLGRTIRVCDPTAIAEHLRSPLPANAGTASRCAACGDNAGATIPCATVFLGYGDSPRGVTSQTSKMTRVSLSNMWDGTGVTAWLFWCRFGPIGRQVADQPETPGRGVEVGRWQGGLIWLGGGGVAGLSPCSASGDGCRNILHLEKSKGVPAVANIRVLKEVEKRLASRYNHVRSCCEIDTIGTAVYEFTKYVFGTPVLKELADSLYALEESPTLEEWKAKGGRGLGGRSQLPTQREKKARLCWEMISGWYEDMENGEGDISIGIQNVGHHICSDRKIAVCMMAFVDSFLTPLYQFLDEQLEELMKDEAVKDEEVAEPNPANRRTVFVVHGRDTDTVDRVVAYLKDIGLEPLTFDDAKTMLGTGMPTILQVVDKGMDESWAVLVLVTPDDIAKMREEPDEEARKQARPNVIFEAGLALGRYRKRTVLVEYEEPSMFSDLHGHYVVRLRQTGEGIEGFDDIRKMLKATGCETED